MRLWPHTQEHTLPTHWLEPYPKTRWSTPTEYDIQRKKKKAFSFFMKNIHSTFVCWEIFPQTKHNYVCSSGQITFPAFQLYWKAHEIISLGPQQFLSQCNYILKINMRKVFESKLGTFCSCWINSVVCWDSSVSRCLVIQNSSGCFKNEIEQERQRLKHHTRLSGSWTIVADSLNEHMQIENDECILWWFDADEQKRWTSFFCVCNEMKSYECCSF